MKIRRSFVSNSSSSSFVCDMCGEPDYRDVVIQCVKGHAWHDYHLVGDTDVEWGALCDEDGVIAKGEVNEGHCPFCQLQQLADIDELNFFRKLYPELTKEAILKELRELRDLGENHV